VRPAYGDLMSVKRCLQANRVDMSMLRLLSSGCRWASWGLERDITREVGVEVEDRRKKN